MDALMDKRQKEITQKQFKLLLYTLALLSDWLNQFQISLNRALFSPNFHNFACHVQGSINYSVHIFNLVGGDFMKFTLYFLNIKVRKNSIFDKKNTENNINVSVGSSIYYE